MKIFLLIITLFSLIQTCQADSFSSTGRQSSDQAIFLLNNPDLREQYIRQSAQMHEADQKLRDLAGSQATSENIYSLAAEIFADLIIRTQGDPDTMLQLLQEAQQNPEAFAYQLTDEQKRRLSELAKQIQSNRQ